MYTRQQASLLKQTFWTVFGRYMSPVPAMDGTRVNWVNYKTGYKFLFFRMEVTNKSAHVAIELTNPDLIGLQEDYEKLRSLQPLLESHLEESWEWQHCIEVEAGKIISTVSCSKSSVNVFDQGTFPAIISFLKPRIIALDAFWQIAKDFFV